MIPIHSSINRIEWFASNWGSQFVNIGAKGHINTSAGVGNWQDGEEYLKLVLDLHHKKRPPKIVSRFY